MTKQCARCGKTKQTTEYSKCKANKDGLQYQCKSCNKETNQKFRVEIDPEYQNKWYHKYTQYWTDYMARYQKADKLPIIYAIVAPDGKQYIGATMMHLGVRRSEHIRHYKRALKGKRDRLPGLHDSFDKYGLENHQFKLIKECPGFNRKQLLTLESAYITLDKAQKISLNQKS